MRGFRHAHNPVEATLAGSEKPDKGKVLVRQELISGWGLLHWQSAPVEIGKAINSV